MIVTALLLCTMLAAVLPARAQSPAGEQPPELLYQVVFGGDRDEQLIDIAADAAGNLYLLGTTRSLDFPTLRAAQPRPGGDDCAAATRANCIDAFLVSLDPRGRRMRYSTYFGGSGVEQPTTLAVAPDGTVSIAGITESRDLPLVESHPAALGRTLRGPNDAFLAVFDSTGKLTASGYLGGSQRDEVHSLAWSPDRSIVLTGATLSPDFPLAAPLQPRLSSPTSSDAFVTRISADLDRLLFSTYLGGSGSDSGEAITIGAGGAIYLTGSTSSPDFPLLRPVQAGLGETGGRTPFVGGLRADGSALLFSTYLGGNQYAEHGSAIAVKQDGSLLVALNGSQTGAVAGLTIGGRTLAYRNDLGPPGDVAFDQAGQAYAAIMPYPNTTGLNLPEGIIRPPCPVPDRHIVLLDTAGEVSATILAPISLQAFTLGAEGQLFMAGARTGAFERIGPPGLRLGAGSGGEDDADVYVAALNAGPGRQGWQWPPPSYFAETIEEFAQLWAGTDRVVSAGGPRPDRPWLWGPAPLTAPFCELIDSTPGDTRTRTAQYFDKGRMELNQDPVDAPLTGGALVVELISGQLQSDSEAVEQRAPAEEVIAGDPAVINPTAPTYRDLGVVAWPLKRSRAAPARDRLVTALLEVGGTVRAQPDLERYDIRLGPYDQRFGHNIARVFADFLARQELFGTDWQAIMGAPLSEPYWVQTRVGGIKREVLIQPFERRILTYMPSNLPAWRIEFGNVGRHYLAWRYGHKQRSNVEAFKR